MNNWYVIYKPSLDGVRGGMKLEKQNAGKDIYVYIYLCVCEALHRIDGYG